jgi:predicted site-specific integrase-resolvase
MSLITNLVRLYQVNFSTNRIGFPITGKVYYIVLLLEAQGRRIEVINESDTKDELVDDFVALITSMAARIYGKRQSKRRAAQIRQCVEETYAVDG